MDRGRGTTETPVRNSKAAPFSSAARNHTEGHAVRNGTGQDMAGKGREEEVETRAGQDSARNESCDPDPRE